MVEDYNPNKRYGVGDSYKKNGKVYHVYRSSGRNKSGETKYYYTDPKTGERTEIKSVDRGSGREDVGNVMRESQRPVGQMVGDVQRRQAQAQSEAYWRQRGYTQPPTNILEVAQREAYMRSGYDVAYTPEEYAKMQKAGSYGYNFIQIETAEGTVVMSKYEPYTWAMGQLQAQGLTEEEARYYVGASARVHEETKRRYGVSTLDVGRFMTLEQGFGFTTIGTHTASMLLGKPKEAYALDVLGRARQLYDIEQPYGIAKKGLEAGAMGGLAGMFSGAGQIGKGMVAKGISPYTVSKLGKVGSGALMGLGGYGVATNLERATAGDIKSIAGLEAGIGLIGLGAYGYKKSMDFPKQFKPITYSDDKLLLKIKGVTEQRGTVQEFVSTGKLRRGTEIIGKYKRTGLAYVTEEGKVYMGYTEKRFMPSKIFGKEVYKVTTIKEGNLGLVSKYLDLVKAPSGSQKFTLVPSEKGMFYLGISGAKNKMAFSLTGRKYDILGLEPLGISKLQIQKAYTTSWLKTPTGMLKSSGWTDVTVKVPKDLKMFSMSIGEGEKPLKLASGLHLEKEFAMQDQMLQLTPDIIKVSLLPKIAPPIIEQSSAKFVGLVPLITPMVKQTPIVSLKQEIIQLPIQEIGLGQKQTPITIPELIQEPITEYPPAMPTPIPPTPSPPIELPEPKIPPLIPFDSYWDMGVKKPFRRSGQKKRYTASLGAFYFGVKSKKIPKDIFTGGEVFRPIIIDGKRSKKIKIKF